MTESTEPDTLDLIPDAYLIVQIGKSGRVKVNTDCPMTGEEIAARLDGVNRMLRAERRGGDGTQFDGQAPIQER